MPGATAGGEAKEKGTRAEEKKKKKKKKTSGTSADTASLSVPHTARGAEATQSGVSGVGGAEEKKKKTSGTSADAASLSVPRTARGAEATQSGVGGVGGAARPEAQLYRVEPEVMPAPRIVGGIVNSATVNRAEFQSQQTLARLNGAPPLSVPRVGAAAGKSGVRGSSGGSSGSASQPAASQSLVITATAVAEGAASAARAAVIAGAASGLKNDHRSPAPVLSTGTEIRPQQIPTPHVLSSSDSASTLDDAATQPCMVCHNGFAPDLLDLDVCKACAALAGKVRCIMCNSLHSSTELRAETCASCVAMKERFQKRAVAAHDRGPT